LLDVEGRELVEVAVTEVGAEPGEPPRVFCAGPWAVHLSPSLVFRGELLECDPARLGRPRPLALIPSLDRWALLGFLCSRDDAAE
jgi:hypothetical protein